MHERVQKLSLIVGAALVMFGVVSPTFGASLTTSVPGTSNPYLAGVPNGTACCFGDSAPGQSPVGPFAVSSFQQLTFSASGSVANGTSCTPSPECSTNGPDGGAFFVSQQTGQPGTDSNNGIARINAPLNALVGVFLDDSDPRSSGAPAGLDFSGAGLGISQGALAPGLKQPFFIGDGRTGTGGGAVQTFFAPNGATRLFLGTVDGIGWANNAGAFSVTIDGLTTGGTAGPLAAAVLPLSRAVQVGATATAFATILNVGNATATGCSITPTTSVPASFVYQTTNSSNAVTGTPNTPASIPAGGGQSFVMAFTPSAAFGATNVSFSFACSNAAAASVINGVNTFTLSASSSPVPDIIMVVATSPNDGIVRINAGTGAFAVATTNLGATGSVTIAPDTGGVGQPVSLFICQSNPATGVCITPLQSSITTTIAAGAQPTFVVFINATGSVPLNPAVNRIFVRANGGNAGATSVADVTQ